MRNRLISLASLILLPAALAAAFPTPTALESTLLGASVGEQIDLPFSSTSGIRALNAAPNRLAITGGALIYSDDPETALAPGILYRDVLPAGNQRVYLYHVNGLSAQHRFSIVLENQGTEPAMVTPTRRSFPTPSGNYIAVGREGVRLFYEAPVGLAPFTIPPGGTALLDPALDAARLSINQLAGPLYEYHSTVPLRVATVMVPVGADTLATYPGMAFSPNDGDNRQGTFAGFNRIAPAAGYTWRSSEGIVRLRVGDGGQFETDPPAPGTNAENGNAATTLRGNYGITYDVTLTFNNDSATRAAVLVNPRGGSYGGYFRVSMNDQLVSAPLVPSTGLVIAPTTKAGVIALLDPPRGTSTLRLELIPAGASSLAIDLLLVPYSSLPPATGPAGWLLSSATPEEELIRLMSLTGQ